MCAAPRERIGRIELQDNVEGELGDAQWKQNAIASTQLGEVYEADRNGRAQMVLGVPLSEIAWLALAIVVGGVITGILAGLFGIGGGGVIVPVLYEVFRTLGVSDDIRMQLCVGTSIAIIVPTTVRSFLAHREKGLVVPGVIRLWALPAVIGVACSSAIAAFAPAAVLKVAFVVIAAFIGAKFLLAGDRWNIGDQLPGRVPMTIYGFAIGMAGSLMGISGGSLSSIVLTLYRKSIHQAVATSAGLGVPIAIAGTVGYILAGLSHQAELPPLSLGFVSLPGLIVMAPVSSLTAPYGARLAHNLSRRKLEVSFGLFLILMSLRFLASLF